MKGERTIITFNKDNTYNVVNSTVNKQIINLEPLDGQISIFILLARLFSLVHILKNGGFRDGKNEIDAKLN